MFYLWQQKQSHILFLYRVKVCNKPLLLPSLTLCALRLFRFFCRWLFQNAGYRIYSLTHSYQNRTDKGFSPSVKSGKIPVILQSDIFTHKFTTLQTGALKKKDHRLKVVFSLIRQPFSTFSSSSG